MPWMGKVKTLFPKEQVVFNSPVPYIFYAFDIHVGSFDYIGLIQF